MATMTITDQREYLATAAVTFYSKKPTKPLAGYALPVVDNLGPTPKTVKGFQWRLPYSFGDHSVVTEVATGYEQINMNTKQIQNAGYDAPKTFVAPVVITEKELRDLSGVEIINLFDSRLASTQFQMKRDFQRRVLGVAGTPFGTLNTWNGEDYANGMFENVAPGSQTRVVHNISKLTYQSAPRWQNSYYDIASAFGTNGRTAFNRVAWRARAISGKPNIKGASWYISQLFGENCSKVLEGKEQYTTFDFRKNIAGNTDFLLCGLPVYPTPDLPLANVGLPTATNKISAFLIDHDTTMFVCLGQTDYPEGLPGSESFTSRPRWFTNTGKVRPVGNGYMINFDLIGLEGQLMAAEPEYDMLDISQCAVLTNGEVY